MQRTIRFLRVALPVVFFGFILLIVMSWTRVKSKGREKGATDPVVAVRVNEKPRVESKGFEDTQTIGGRVVSRIRAKRVVSYTSNWNTLEDVQLTLYRINGLTYELTCPSAQFNSQTKEAEAKGGVQVTSSDGVEIHTAEIHFDGNRLTNHIPVTFRIDRWSGKGGALDLDVEAESLRLFEKLTATMSPESPTESPLTITGGEGLFRRRENDVAFDRDVVFTRLADRLTCDRMLGKFSADRKKMVSMDGNGKVMAYLSSNPGVDENLGGGKTITCDHVFSEVTPAGDISAFNFIGDTAPSHLVIDGPPKRDIVAHTFRAGLNGKVISDIKADDAVVMKELAEPPREIKGDHVVIYFDQATHQAANTSIDGNFHYTDPENTASAKRANYDIVNDRVILNAEPGSDPTVNYGGQILKAREIEFSPRAGTAKASGSVIAQLSSKENGPSADSTTVFPSNKPVFVNSDTLTLRQSTKVGVFSGNVRAWQETNTLFAQELQVQGAGESLLARGGVRTILYNATSDPMSHKVPILSSSDQMIARKNDRRIDLSGNVKIDDSQRSLNSEKASFFFDAGKKIDRIEAETKVVLIERAANRKGTGDRAVYAVPKRMIYINGTPAVMTAPTGTLSGQQIVFDLTRNRVDVVSPTSPTQGTYKPQ